MSSKLNDTERHIWMTLRKWDGAKPPTSGELADAAGRSTSVTVRALRVLEVLEMIEPRKRYSQRQWVAR